MHKLKIALKELNETNVWLRMISRSQLLKSALLELLVTENIELCRIVNASVSTAKRPDGPDDSQPVSIAEAIAVIEGIGGKVILPDDQ